MTPERILLAFALVVLLFIWAIAHIIPAEAYHVKNEHDLLLEQIEELAWCESRNDPSAINYHDQPDGSHSYGLLQFSRQTWSWANERYGYDFDIMNPNHQKIIAYEMLKEGRYYHWLWCSNHLRYETN